MNSRYIDLVAMLFFLAPSLVSGPVAYVVADTDVLPLFLSPAAAADKVRTKWRTLFASPATTSRESRDNNGCGWFGRRRTPHRRSCRFLSVAAPKRRLLSQPLVIYRQLDCLLLSAFRRPARDSLIQSAVCRCHSNRFYSWRAVVRQPSRAAQVSCGDFFPWSFSLWSTGADGQNTMQGGGGGGALYYTQNVIKSIVITLNGHLYSCCVPAESRPPARPPFHFSISANIFRWTGFN